MADWSNGYVTEIGYTFGYYPELNPGRIRLAFLNAGLKFPAIGTACELGFGQGVSTNMHAAASTVSWHGNDFNPSQAGFAQEMAAAAGHRARLTDGAFAEFCADPALPDFDFIALHGIWSWVDRANWAVIADFIGRKLKVGGVLYIGYNTQPGWAGFAPVRELLIGHKEACSAPGLPPADKIDAALAFTERIFATAPRYVQRHPELAERLAGLASQDRNYLAHEYFNRDWTPVPFAEMHRWLAPCKLEYACSSNYFDHVQGLGVTPAQRALLDEIADPVYRETVRDFMLNTQFRKDYWVKGARRLEPFERLALLRQERLVLAVTRARASLRGTGPMGTFEMDPASYVPLLDFFADCQPHTVAELEQRFVTPETPLNELFERLMILVGVGHVVSAQDEAATAQAAPTAHRLNRWIMEQACGSAALAYLAAPVIGGAVAMPRVPLIMLLAHCNGAGSAAELAAATWQVLKAQGQNLVIEGRTLDTDAANLAQLEREARVLLATHLPLLAALRVIP